MFPALIIASRPGTARQLLHDVPNTCKCHLLNQSDQRFAHINKYTCKKSCLFKIEYSDERLLYPRFPSPFQTSVLCPYNATQLTSIFPANKIKGILRFAWTGLMWLMCYPNCTVYESDEERHYFGRRNVSNSVIYTILFNTIKLISLVYSPSTFNLHNEHRTSNIHRIQNNPKYSHHYKILIHLRKRNVFKYTCRYSSFHFRCIVLLF